MVRGGGSGRPRGSVIQVRHATQLATTEYVERQGWVAVELSVGSLPQRVGAILTIVRGLDPDRYLEMQPTRATFQAALAYTMVLVGLRAAAADHLRGLPTPVGFNHRALNGAGAETRNRRQQSTGRDPPPAAA